MKKHLFLFLIAGLLFSACTTGLGEEIDLEAPLLTIETPKNLSNSHKKVIISGTCSDNVGVTSVSIEDKERGVFYGDASIDGNKWIMNLELPEGEVTLQATAHDKSGNYSIKSSKAVTLLVDETAPEGLSWYVDRGNYVQVSFEEKEILEQVNTNDATKKNIPQNEKFTIHGRMYDAMSLNTVTLILTDEDNKKIIKEVKAESIPENTSIYTPSFTFTHEELVNENPRLDSGKHYLKVSYYSCDDAGNNSTKILGYIMWYPESDIPGIWQKETKFKDGKYNLQINHGSAIPLHFYDDDKIEEYGYCFINEDDPKFATVDETLESIKAFITAPANTDPEKNKTAENPNPATGKYGVYKKPENSISEDPTAVDSIFTDSVGSYALICYIKDVGGNENVMYINTVVIDASNPLLIIESPVENTVPEIKEGTKFEITGYTYDTSGCKNVKIAFIPDSVASTADAKLTRAKELFADSSKVNAGKGEIVKEKEFTSDKSGLKEDNWVKEKFEFEFDVLDDFKNSNQTTKSKDFILIVEDTDGNEVVKQLRVNGDSQLPEITVKNPTANMEVCDYGHKDLIFTFKGEKESKLPVDETTYRIERKIDDNNYFVWSTKPITNQTPINGNLIKTEKDGKTYWEQPINDGTEESPEWKISVLERDPLNTGYYKLVIPKGIVKNWAEKGVKKQDGTELIKADTQPVFTLYISDVLGNTKSQQIAVVLSPLPVLDNISTINANGIYKAGDVITLQTKFSDTVTVTGTPKLKLKYKESDDSYVTADYKTGTGTDTLTFEWTVPEGADSKKLLCDGFETEVKDGKEILKDGAKIETGTSGTGSATLTVREGFNLQDSASLEIDGIAPTLKTVFVTTTPIISVAADSKIYVKKDMDIIVTLEFTEPIFVSGSPELKIGNNKFNFQSIDGTKVKFSHRVTASSKEESLVYKYNSTTKSFTDAHKKLITDEAGNIISLSDKTQDLKLTIDTTAPANAPSINIVAGIYNKPQTLILSGIESKAKAEYSTDSGVTWNTYTEEEVKIGAGEHAILTRQTDLAGNVTQALTPVNVIINNTFPEVQSILISGADGDYIVGDVLKFKVFLSETVKPFGEKAISLTFKNKAETLKVEGETKTGITIYAKPEETDVNTIEFEYTVKKNDYVNGVQVTGLNFGTVKDKYENQKDEKTQAKIEELTQLEDCNRSEIKLDGVVPFISTYTPAINTVGKYIEADDVVKGYKKGDFIITLTFSENVSKEAGNITLQRTSGWAIPAVFTTEEFSEVYDQLTDISLKEKLMLTEAGNGSGSERLDAWTGIAVGPYKKITHGLKVEGGKYVPDTATKYVLDFDLDLETGSKEFDPHSNSPVTISVAEIREALEATGYHQHVTDVNSTNVKITDNVVTIRYPATYKNNVLVKDGIENGLEWELLIDSGAFRDDTGNIFEGLEAGTYTLNSDKVSTPVVRVDRYSHGLGAREPDASGNLTEISKWMQPKQGNLSTTGYTEIITKQNGSGRTIAPTGCVRVRIDTQTKNATIKYTIYESGTKKISDTGANYYQYSNDSSATATLNKSNVNVIYNSITDLGYTLTANIDASTTADGLNLSKATLTEIKPDNNHIFVIDDTFQQGNQNVGYESASKKYVKAQALKTNFKDSAEGIEGVFKTLVYLSYDNSDGVNIEGGTAKGGEPNLSGFPLRDATTDIRYSKNPYFITGNYYAWVSYEIVSDYALLIHKGNYSKNYPKGSYGQILYAKKFQSW